ncbi:MAG: PDZ domain-containing protein, partial [bacterium]
MSLKALIPLSLLSLLAACASQPKPPVAVSKQPTQSALELRRQGAPYAGVWLGEAEHGGAVVLGVIAGPAAIAGLMTGDRILRIDDVEVDANRAQAKIETSSPGTRLRLQIVRGTAPLEIELVIDERDRWLTPAAFPAAVLYAATGLADTIDAPDPVIERALSLAPSAVPINDRLDRMFAQLARNDAGYHKLPLIRTALMRPGAMTTWRDKLVQQMRPTGNDRGRVIQVICETLALACPAPSVESGGGPTTLSAFAAEIGSANRRVREVFSKANVDRAQATLDLHYLM